MLRRLLLMGWPVVLVAMLIGFVGGYLYVFGGSPTYTASATLYVAPPTSSSPTDAQMGDTYAARRTELYLELAHSDELAQRVAAQLQSSETPKELASRVTVTGSHDAPLLTLVSTGSTQDDARNLINAYVDQFPEYAKNVELGSGLREGPVLVVATGPQDLGKTTSGLRSWVHAVLPAAVLGVLALFGVLRYRSKRPDVRNLRALRNAVPESFVQVVRSDPDDLSRVHAILFAAPTAPRTLILAGIRTGDDLDKFSTVFANSLIRAGISHEHVKASELGSFQKSRRSHEIVIIDAPALLDETERIPMLATYATAAVIVARGRKTSVQDVAELSRLLGMNGVEVSGVLNVAQIPVLGTSAKGSARSDKDGENPWPSIDVLEAAAGRRGERGST